MEIDLVKLKIIIDRFFEYIIETRGIKSYTLKQDYYWNIPVEEVYDLSRGPSEIDVGSLHDEWEFLQGALGPEVEPVIYQLTELAPIIRYLGETFNQYGPKE